MEIKLINDQITLPPKRKPIRRNMPICPSLKGQDQHARFNIFRRAFQ